MERTYRGSLFWPLVQALAREAVERRDVPADVAAAAERAVLARFDGLAHRPLDSAMQRRVAAYFWGTVRRRALRHAPGYAQRIVRASMAADLADAGWDRHSIHAELEGAGLSA